MKTGHPSRVGKLILTICIVSTLIVIIAYVSSPVVISWWKNQYPSPTNQPQSYSSGITRAASDIRLLVIATEESKSQFAEAVKDTQKKKPDDFKTTSVSVQNLGVQLADSYGELYGSTVKDSVTQLWNTHSVQYIQYVSAVRHHKDRDANTSKERLEETVDALISRVKAANPEIPSAAVTLVLEEYVHELRHLIEPHEPEEAEHHEVQAEPTQALTAAVIPQREIQSPVVAIMKDRIQPNTVLVPVTSNLVLVNEDSIVHEFTQGRGNDFGQDHDHQNDTDHFETPAFGPGEAVRITITEPGIYFVHDHLQPDLVLTIVAHE